jgi:hypothetical protein
MVIPYIPPKTKGIAERKKSKAVGNSLKDFRNDGKVFQSGKYFVNFLERFQNYGKGFTLRKKMRMF